MADFAVYSMGHLIDHVQGESHVAAMLAVERKYAAGPLAICPLSASRATHKAAAARSYYTPNDVPPELRGFPPLNEGEER
ncbi:hypothetical protein [Burkholderia sp. Ed8]|uniref:hypothetical protein n=1 Tax=Burkholderia sp. Ed8 TaxID=3112957 RepID=UPI00345CD938